MKKSIIIISLAFVVLMYACEERFERTNVSYTSLSDEIIAQDYNFGTRFAPLLRNLTTDQTGEDLTTDNFVRHMATPTNFENNRNNTTYYIIDGWNNNMWNRCYNNVMAPANAVKKLAVSMDLPLFKAWADLIQVFILSRTTVYYGPLIYSEYGQDKKQYDYDSEEFLYQQFFAKLDTVQTVFKTYADAKSEDLVRFDASYNGELAKWLKMINSLRLRLAIRISKADPELAKQEGEKAMNDPVGLILTNEDNFNHSLHGSVMPIWQICQSWNDTRMGAGMEEVLLGYNDPRLEKWFARVPASVVVKKGDNDVTIPLDSIWADHPAKPYKGIASGSYIAAKDDRLNYSKVSTYFQTVNERKLLQAAEVNFALAEAKLREWTGVNATKTVGEYYEDGVRASMAEWDVTSAKTNAYLTDNTSLPINYVDPVDPRNSYETRQKLTIKWDDAVDLELKLERIMTQKWIASFTNANEIWSDHRRTGYPKLHYTPKNDSNETWGTIGREDFLKRMPFILAERQNNAAGLVEATKKLGGDGDKISTRLWIHPDGPNF